MAGTKPNHGRLEAWIWVLIYGGLFGVVLGLVAGRVDAPLGWWLAVPGAVAASAGALLIWVRARMGD